MCFQFMKICPQHNELCPPRNAFQCYVGDRYEVELRVHFLRRLAKNTIQL